MSNSALRRLVICLAVLAALYLVCACIVRFVQHIGSDLDVGRRITSRSEWPETLVGLLEDADGRDINVEDVNVYYISNVEYFWEFEASPELLTLMTARWKLSRVNGNHRLVRLVVERMPSNLSAPEQGSDVDYFLCDVWLAGEKGHYFCVMNDKSHKRIVVRYYYNW